MRCGKGRATVGVADTTSTGTGTTNAIADSAISNAIEPVTSIRATTAAIGSIHDAGSFDATSGTCGTDAVDRSRNARESDGAGANDRGAIGRDSSSGKLYYLLSNQIYVGRVKHHKDHFEGEHPAIIDAGQFAKVQALLGKQSSRRKGSSPNEADIHLLTGIVFDETGDRLSPAYAKNHGKRYRYYVPARLKNSHGKKNGGWRIPAHELEAVVDHLFTELYTDQPRLSEWVQQFASTRHIVAAMAKATAYAAAAASDRKALLRSVFQRIVVSNEKISCQIDRKALVTILCENDSPGKSVASQDSDDALDTQSATFTVDLPIAIKRRGLEKRIIIDNHVQARLPDAKLVDLIAKANLYLTTLTDGEGCSIADVATRCGVHRADISRVLPLAFLSPKIVEAILTGHQPPDLTIRRLARSIDLPLAWRDQEATFGF